MALDNRSIVITLKLENQQSESESKPTDTESAIKKTDKNSNAKAVAAFAAIQMAELVAGEVSSWAEYYWNRDLMLNDDYIGQRNKQIAVTQINRAVGAISTIGSMTAAGATLGPVGAAIGFAVGTATSIFGIVRSNLQGQDQQNIMLRQIDAQLDFTRSRAGWSLKAGSIGEDL